jgi:Zn-dependent peptidase ImmA (M78 family)
MNSAIVKRIEIESRKYLDKFNIKEAPVPIEEIAEKMGIKISYAPSEEYSGMLIRKENSQALMGINSNEIKTRMRFTIAHEVAHYIFDTKSEITIDYRNSFNMLDKSDEEKRADLFAANILMPKKWIHLDFEKIPRGSFSQEHLTNLAKKYKVSLEAMKYRLVNMGLINGLF